MKTPERDGIAAQQAEPAQGRAAADTSEPAGTGSGRRSGSYRAGNRLADLCQLALMAALAYVPLLATQPGRVASDTKAYLYLDPGRLLASALSMWDPSAAGGGVTHQNIGYLLPQGPWYWFFAKVGVPTWVAQRLWLGTLLFAAGAGVWYLARILGLGAADGPGGRSAGGRLSVLALTAAAAGPTVAGVAYMLSPYFLQYSQRISALVLPWSGLGWMVAFTVLALRRGGWRYPALFGLVVAIVGGTNATALLYVGIAPVLWLLYALLVTREVSWPSVVSAAARLGGIAVLVSLWWMAALGVESGYGLDVLRYTETVQAVATTSSPQEVLRGLGYWFFYGGDELGPWVTASVQYETFPWLVASSFLLPCLSLAAGVLTRWRHRAYFAALVLVGLVLSVGSNPYDNPGLVGRELKAFMTGTTAGFALRSTDRATPLLLLGLAMLLGAGASAVARRWRLGGSIGAVALVALAVANAAPLVTGGAVEAKYSRPSQLPGYVIAAASYLDSAGDSTRVLFEPGENVGAYDFGTTNDSIWPGVMTRPTIERQQLIAGGAASADLLEALDLTVQDGTYEPASLAPIARLMSAGDVVIQSDLAYWWYGTPMPRETWPLFDTPPAGIGRPVSFGPPVGDDAPTRYENVDSASLALPADSPDPPALAVFPVSDARPIYRAEPAAAPLVVDGSGAGLVAAAAAGLLDDNPTIIYAGSLSGDSTLAKEALAPGAALLLTDSNAEVLQRWTSVDDNIGEVETSPPAPTAPDPSAVPLVLFPGAPPSTNTTAVYPGAVYVTASAYGNPFTFAPESAPYQAFDGDNATGWSIDAFGSPVGNWIEVKLPHPVSVSHIDLEQAPKASPAHSITKVTLSFDGGQPVEANLGAASLTTSGQVVSFPERTFTTLRITIDGAGDPGERPGEIGPVGFAEVRIPGVEIHQLLALPTDLLSGLGAASLAHRLTIVLTRDRVGPGSSRSDPEPTLSRLFALPTERDFTVTGTAIIRPDMPDDTLDALLGGTTEIGGIRVSSSGHLTGDVDARAVSALDGDDATAWTTSFGNQVGAWILLDVPHKVSFDHLDLRIVADGRHSVPTAINIQTDEGGNVTVPLPPIKDAARPGATVEVRVDFPALSGRVLRFSVAAVRNVETANYQNGGQATMPIGIAELGVPGLRVTPENPAAPLPDVCRTNLLTVDGKPVGLRVEGTVGEAEAGSGLAVVGCGSAAHGLELSSGSHVVETPVGDETGFDIDRLLLDSAAGGAAMPLAAAGSVQPAAGTLASPGSPALAAPSVRVLSSSSTSARLQVSGANGPFWLVLGESQNPGWDASVEGGAQLGPSVLVDGMSNGWYVDPPAGNGTFVVDLSFAPQRAVWLALAVSAVALLACLVLAVWPRRRRRRHAPGESPQPLLATPLRSAGRPPSLAAIALLALLAGAVAASLPPPPYGPFVGVGAALATALALRFCRARALLTLAVVGSGLAIACTTAITEVVRRPVAGAGWPSAFLAAAVLTWVAVIALAADALVEVARSRRRGASDADDDTDVSPRYDA